MTGSASAALDVYLHPCMLLLCVPAFPHGMKYSFLCVRLLAGCLQPTERFMGVRGKRMDSVCALTRLRNQDINKLVSKIYSGIIGVFYCVFCFDCFDLDILRQTLVCCYWECSAILGLYVRYYVHVKFWACDTTGLFVILQCEEFNQ